ncbi:MAG: hypothetical protein IPM54_38970 [Polyangiaceae bacterium]|nr:hypothetical protein [Polyangiaceae bacterium]
MRKSFTRASFFASTLSLFLSAAIGGCGGDASTTTGSGGNATGASGGMGGAGGEGGIAGQGGTAGQGGSTGCTDGATQSCYSGPAGTENTGQCKSGTSTCAGGVWGACAGEVLPGIEACNGIDDDCNGQTDDGFPSITCGEGACQVMIEGCIDGMVPTCEPGEPMPETCDGTDENCDGVIDDGINCPCTVEGEMRSCYSGSMSTKDVGQCKAGVQTCISGAWGTCDNEVLPKPEACDSLDNDCDGESDENLGQITCGAGACLVSVTACVNGVPQTCTPLQPQTETCNGIDDDCNLFIDDNLGSVTCGVGACQATVPACSGGQMQTCTPGMPSPEICDGIDNNCNGAADENNPGGGGNCITGQPGICSAGTQVCSGGALQCVANMMPSPEICDSKDNNCNGQTDEGNPGGGMACMTGQLGVCAAGTTNCSGGNIVCTQNTQSSPEVCDGLDNNCNGASDEGNPGGGSTCTVAGKVGPCAQGTLNCQNGSPTCVQTVFPTTESCNNIDDNCNGMVDEGNPQSGGTCTTALPGVCSAGTFQCQSGALVCVQSMQPSNEICDNKDNDCDGSIDEGNPGSGQSCNTGGLGICALGTTACSAGMIVCNQTSLPTNEACDGLDNDCDGSTDEGNPGGGGACTTGQPGICSAGTLACSNGALVCNQNQQPQTEVCDGLDNNCNGQVNEGNPGGGQSCSVPGQSGPCAAGTTACTSGAIVCNQTTFPTGEACDNVDNDCDGTVDEGNPGGGASCTVSGQVGPCANGTITCSSGALGCAQTVFPVTEVCGDGNDNDCNGTVDNGCGCAHDKCTTGVAMQSGCDPCVTQICAADPYCCNNSWDSACVQEVRTICNSLVCLEAAGTCAHSPCTVGPNTTTPLTNGCDSAQANCVALVCAQDSYCCTTDWDSYCVSEVETYCPPYTCN